jgi:hypothetical protein
MHYIDGICHAETYGSHVCLSIKRNLELSRHYTVVDYLVKTGPMLVYLAELKKLLQVMAK